MEEDYKLARWMAGEMTREELSEFQKSPKYREYERIATAAARLEAPEFYPEPILKRVLSAPKQKVIRLIDRAWFRAAAAIVVLLGIGLVIRAMLPVSESAGIAMQHSFVLPDDSQVVLNSGSQATYSKWNWDSDRRVELAGEAFFKVAKGQKFTVGTANGSVTVLGTQFNVRARGDRFEVSCFEGRVRVDHGGKTQVLTRGQAVAFASGQVIPAPQLSGSPDWMLGELSFSHESLTEIVAELNRQQPVRIELRGVESAQLFTGTLPAGNIDQAISILASAYHLEISKSANGITLSPADARP